MNKSLMWVGGLVVLVVVVVLVASGGGDKKEGEGGDANRLTGDELTPMDLEFGETMYRVIESRLASIDSVFGKQEELAQFMNQYLLGDAWVTSVEAVGTGWRIALDVDPPENKQGGAEITGIIDLSQTEAPAVGQKVRFESIIDMIDTSGQRCHIYVSRIRVLKTRSAKR